MADDNKQEKHEAAEKAAGWLTKVLTGWGVPGAIARVIAGAIVGAVAAWYLATSTGCSVTYTKLPDGTVVAQGSVAKPVHVTK